jgi:hypothetical protein
MIVTAWHREDGLVIATLPCGHEAQIRLEWLSGAGRFNGRCMCPVCRKITEALALEGWES